LPAARSAITDAPMTARITLRKPDDWHLHVRDGEMLKAVLPYTARQFGRAILMPNLVPPIRTTQEAVAYRERVLAALPQGSRFQPLMTCYLTDETDPDDVDRGFRDGVFIGVKLYPANATTNSAAGVTDYRNIVRVLERMEKIGMPFLIHGEEVGPDIDIFDREAMFIERRLSKWVKDFPGLRMTMEHLSSKQGAEFVKSAAPQIGGTITPYHLNLTRTDWLGAGIKPMMYAMPVAPLCARRRSPATPVISSAPIPRRIRSRAKSRSAGFPASSMRRSRLPPMPRSSKRKAHSTSSKRLPRSTAQSITACRRTRIKSCWKRRRGPRRSRSRSRDPTSARCSIAAARPSSGRWWCEFSPPRMQEGREGG
jgi:dihydroorotase (homodimeric type)